MKFNRVSRLSLKVEPRNLREAKEYVFALFPDARINVMSERKLDQLLKKIEGKRNLSLSDMKFGMIRIDLLNEPQQEYLDQQISIQDNLPFVLGEIFNPILKLVKPWKAIQKLVVYEESNFKELENYDLFYENKDLVLNKNSSEEFAISFCDKMHSFSDLTNLKMESHQLGKLIDSALTGYPVYSLFENSPKMLLEYLWEKNEVSNFLHLVELYIGNHISLNENWASQILNHTNPINILIKYILDLGIEQSEFKKNLRAVLGHYKETNKFFDKMRELNYERAVYWENNIKRFDNVLVKSFGTKKYSMAFFYKGFVVVESAPVGNAAYFYSKEIFERSIFDSTDWGNRNLCGFNNSNMHTDLRNGYFPHIGNWQRRMDRILEAIFNV